MNKNTAKKFLGLTLASALSVIAITSGVGCGKNSNTDDRNLTAQQFSFANIVGEDDYGRKVSVRDASDEKSTYVGVFYSAWLGTHMEHHEGNVYDVNKLETENPDDLYDKSAGPNSDSPVERYHFASEPLYGYYSMRDEWIVNRHVELLSMSGIDYLMFDNTNARVYDDATHLVAKTLIKYKNQGWKVPKIAFYTNANSYSTVLKLYNNFYSTHPEYDEIWFRMNGDPRPVIVGVSSNNYVPTAQGEYKYSSDWFTRNPNAGFDLGNAEHAELHSYFNFFESQWPTNAVVRNDKFGLPWMSTWDLPPVAHQNGNIAVSVNKHSGSSVFSSSKYNISSRGYNGGSYTSASGKDADWKKGGNIEWQMSYARPQIEQGRATNLLITGWNEWMAVKMNSDSDGVGFKVDPNTGKEVFFVDAYNAEYSRDLEMGKVYGDGFYMQLLRHVREIKFGDAKAYVMPTKTISDLTDFTLWNDVKTEYADFVGDAIARDGESAANKQHAYIDNTNRNDIASIKVICDNENIYFLVTTKEDITAYKDGDKYWMNIMISTGNASNKSFMGFDYIINRSPNANGKTSIEKCATASTYAWSNTASTAEYYVDGNKIAYKIPLSALGLTSANPSFTFKVCDNVAKPAERVENGEVITETNFDPEKLDYYIYGDSAPIGTLGYAYNAQPKA